MGGRPNLKLNEWTARSLGGDRFKLPGGKLITMSAERFGT